METASKFVVQRKSAICLTTNESRRVYRDTTTELIVACSLVPGGSEPLHKMGAHTEALRLTADSSSSSDEDETYEAV